MNTQETIVAGFRMQLRLLIDDEQQRRKFDLREMIAFLQSHVSLPEFYQAPAQTLAVEILNTFPDSGVLQSQLQEVIKAVYGAWIRENYRGV